MIRNDVLRCGRRGFTLIEVLLTVMIIAVIGGSLYATFAAGFKLDHRINLLFVDLDESRIIGETLRRDLGRAVYYDFRGSFTQQKAFADQKEELTLVIDDGQQLLWVRYRLMTDQEDDVHVTQLGTTVKKNVAVSNIVETQETLQMLVREQGRFVQLFNIQQNLVPDTRDVLTRRIASNGWETFYAASVTPQAKTEWRNDWSEDYLPAAVRVNVSLQNNKGQVKKIIKDFLLPAGGHSEK